MGQLIVDTNILIYVLKKDAQLAYLLDQKKIFVSYISELELLSFPKITPSETEITKELLTNCRIIPFADDIKENTISFRKKYNLSLPDAIIAATAQVFFIPLLTADKKFGKIKEIETSIYVTS